MRSFSALIRQTEVDRFNGATFLCFAFFAVTLFSPRPVAITSMFFLSLGDAAAELCGKNFGRVKILHRSIEGAIGFFAVAHIEQIAQHVDGRALLAFAEQGGDGHPQKLAEQIEQCGFEALTSDSPDSTR